MDGAGVGCRYFGLGDDRLYFHPLLPLRLCRGCRGSDGHDLQRSIYASELVRNSVKEQF